MNDQRGGRVARTKAQHTPTPWHLAPCSHGGAILRRGTDERGGHPQTHLQIVPIEDAKFIVRACNAHDDLLALARAVADLVNLNNIENGALLLASEARAVIRKAEIA